MKDMDPIPTLFMWTLITTLGVHHNLTATFGVRIMTDLIQARVWAAAPDIWRGFRILMLKQRPQSFAVLLAELPIEQLKRLLLEHRDQFFEPLKSYAESNRRMIRKPVLEMLGIAVGKAVNK
mmetsp:Transcript_30028/g.41845  ORF Transcript_30028/g.41845 Transcript_30028/m.41845 type:complete len:122 (-) Transcript_30028:72-437(-)